MRKKGIVLLHTSDWHLGRSLYGRKRYSEQEAFLDWLVAYLTEKEVDVLLVAGDVFDSATPSNRAQELYYRFLQRVSGTSCRHVVIIGGNHDSASFLSASRSLLRVLDIHVVSSVGENLSDEIILLKNSEGDNELLVCAVPYLRERDIRQAGVGESPDEKEFSSREGIRAHYEAIANMAAGMREDGGKKLPCVMMGHLFVAGGKALEGDGVRDLYIGTLGLTPSNIFPSTTTYVALGHLHVPQKISGPCEIRYSGSPIAMGFGEAGQQKSVCIVDISHCGEVNVQLEPVPIFQRMEQVRGNRQQILSRIGELRSQRESIWLEVIYDSDELLGDFRDQIEESVCGTPLEILRTSICRLPAQTLGMGKREEKLQDLDPMEVFKLCMEEKNIPEGQRAELQRSYDELLCFLDEAGKPLEQS